MDRRTFFGATVGGVLFRGAVVNGKTPASAYGPMDVDRWMRHEAATGERLHVFLDGQDVTSRCYFSDDTAGEVHLYKWDEPGHILFGGAMREVLHGHVVMIPGD